MVSSSCVFEKKKFIFAQKDSSMDEIRGERRELFISQVTGLTEEEIDIL